VRNTKCLDQLQEKLNELNSLARDSNDSFVDILAMLSHQARSAAIQDGPSQVRELETIILVLLTMQQARLEGRLSYQRGELRSMPPGASATVLDLMYYNTRSLGWEDARREWEDSLGVLLERHQHKVFQSAAVEQEIESLERQCPGLKDAVRTCAARSIPENPILSTHEEPISEDHVAVVTSELTHNREIKAVQVSPKQHILEL